jgi:hypothetical protein
MNIHFKYDPKEKAPLGELVKLCDVALALVHERGQLLKLLRENPVSEECDHIFNATLKRLKNLERVSHEVQLAFHNPVGVEDGRGGGRWGREAQGSGPSRSLRNTPAKWRNDHARG